MPRRDACHHAAQVRENSFKSELFQVELKKGDVSSLIWIACPAAP